MIILRWMPPPGKKLLILNFELTNGTDQEENVDFLSTASRYIITVNDGTRGNALTTMLPNDMSTYVETMAPGETQGLVLLLEVNEDMANGIQNISLRLKNTQMNIQFNFYRHIYCKL